MINKTLTGILSTFSPGEISGFTKFLNSPYFNKKEALILFWNELSKYHPDYQADKQVLYKNIYPGKSYNYGTMKNLVFELTIAAEEFIELENYYQNQDSRNENLLYALLIRNSNQLFRKRLKKISDRLDKNKGDYEYHRKKYRIDAVNQNYLLANESYHGKYKDSLSSFTHLTSAYFIDLFINHYNTAFMKNELNDPEYSLDFIHEALNFYDNVKIEKDFITEIYYYAFMLELTAEEKFFYNLKDIIEVNSGKLSNEQQYNFFVALTNYCIKMINMNRPEFRHEQFSLYKYMVEKNIYSINLIDRMEGNFYRNTAGAASSTGEFDWAINFIEKYKYKLDANTAENYYNYAKTELYIRKKEWNSAADALAKIKHTNLADKLNLKRWNMILFYEMNNFEELRYQVDSAKHFLAKDKTIPASSKENFSNFIEAVNILTKLAVENIKANRINYINKLKKLSEENKISHKDWIEEKLRTLK